MNRGSGLALRGCGRRAVTGCSRIWRAGRQLAAGGVARAGRGRARGGGLVLERLSGPGPPRGGAGGGGRGGAALRRRRRRHAQHRRHDAAARRARGGLAQLHGKPAALLFTSGYVANEAAIGTLARLLPGCLILSDANNHASMIAGVRAAGCEKQIFRHNDLAHLEQLLAAPRASGRSWWRSRACTRWTAISARWPRCARWPGATGR